MSHDFHLISAVGTPLEPDESLHRQGLRAHLEQQWQAGIDGVLVAGTMGLMQLLDDRVYDELIEASCEFVKGDKERRPRSDNHGELRARRLLVGVGDTSFVRTRARIQRLNRLQEGVDGAVVISPYFLRFGQQELQDYFEALADLSTAPLYLYHVPATTHAPLEIETVAALAHHPNIAGIKCSGDMAWARAVRDATAEYGFEVIAAVPTMVDLMFRGGITRQLDGIFALAPGWTAAIADAAAADDWDRAARYQRRITALLAVLLKYGIFPAFTALLNEQGVPGNFAPAPLRPLEASQRVALLREPVARELLGGEVEAPLRPVNAHV